MPPRQYSPTQGLIQLEQNVHANWTIRTNNLLKNGQWITVVSSFDVTPGNSQSENNGKTQRYAQTKFTIVALDGP